MAPPTPHPASRNKLEALLIDGIRRMGLDPTPAQCNQFLSYIDLLRQWGRKINLTAIDDPLDVVDRHFCDSLALWPALAVTAPSAIKGATALLDIGSGAGFPGIPLKIMAPQIALTLLEPRQKRAAFLQVVIAELGCTESRVTVSRLSEFSGAPTAGYHWIVARGVGQFEALIKQAVGFLAPGGCFAFYLSERQSKVSFQHISGFTVADYQYRLPFSAANHRLLLLRRQEVTPPS
jgi:16S rRNA (guanine527-N7)-methyltransferase